MASASGVHFLGTAASVASAGRDHTALAFTNGRRSVVVDCGFNPFGKLLAAGLDPRRTTDLIVTHKHIDHCSALPSFLENLRLYGGRTAPLRVWALPETAAVLRHAIEVFAFELGAGQVATFHELSEQEDGPVFEDEDFAITTWPAEHSVPNVAVRCEFADSGGVVAYSSDTGPNQAITPFYKSTLALIHECTYLAKDAAEALAHRHCATIHAAHQADDAGVEQLYLVHLLPEVAAVPEQAAAEAAGHFGGQIFVPNDLDFLAL
jgi:ribonuclease BN (tRNA processing enzyme)